MACITNNTYIHIRKMIASTHVSVTSMARSNMSSSSSSFSGKVS
jgi:hypothetical protein